MRWRVGGASTRRGLPASLHALLLACPAISAACSGLAALCLSSAQGVLQAQPWLAAHPAPPWPSPLGRPPPGARHRRHLPPPHRAPVALLLRLAAAPVRCAGPPGRDRGWAGSRHGQSAWAAGSRCACPRRPLRPVPVCQKSDPTLPLPAVPASLIYPLRCSADPAGGHRPLGDGLGGAGGRPRDLPQRVLSGHGHSVPAQACLRDCGAGNIACCAEGRAALPTERNPWMQPMECSADACALLFQSVRKLPLFAHTCDYVRSLRRFLPDTVP